MSPPPRFLRANLLVTDLGFLAYWAVTALGVLPPEFAFRDASNPILVAWNWSFLPLDLLASFTGLAALRRGSTALALMSLTFTHVAGLNALAFWAIRGDFSLGWWLPNAYLMLFPLFFARPILNALSRSHPA